MVQTISYVEKYASAVDEKFKELAKSNEVVNQNYSFVGAKTVQVYSVTTGTMNDYARTGTTDRYGTIEDLNNSLQELTMTKDRSFNIAVDKMQSDEAGPSLIAADVLARQLREVVVPEIDKYRFDTMVAGAGNSATAVLSSDNVYDKILDGTALLDDAEVPVDGRKLLVIPSVFKLMKQNADIILDTEMGMDARKKGIIAQLDGMDVMRIPSSRFGTANFGFMIAHPIATTSPVKLADYKIHIDPPGISGYKIEGRVYYDAFVLTNKADAIFAHINTIA